MDFEANGDNIVALTWIKEWFSKFKKNDFELEDKQRSGRLRKFEDDVLHEL